MIHGLACSIKFWMHVGRWEITQEGGRSRGKVGDHGEGGRARGKMGDHARRWEITREGGRSRGKVGEYEKSVPSNFPSASIL